MSQEGTLIETTQSDHVIMKCSMWTSVPDIASETGDMLEVAAPRKRMSLGNLKELSSNPAKILEILKTRGMELARKKLLKCLQGSTAAEAMTAIEDWLIAAESSDLVVSEWIGGRKK